MRKVLVVLLIGLALTGMASARCHQHKDAVGVAIADAEVGLQVKGWDFVTVEADTFTKTDTCCDCEFSMAKSDLDVYATDLGRCWDIDMACLDADANAFAKGENLAITETSMGALVNFCGPCNDLQVGGYSYSFAS